ncbi:hypothetical protein FACS1894140_3610 [Spirochaetia bacterium]|nr:hypothetical protein FACS1894140_3610 [Spirochaetia bacterium]
MFDDPYAVEIYDDENSLLDEERFNVTGTTAIGVINGQYITVSITYREDLACAREAIFVFFRREKLMRLK